MSRPVEIDDQHFDAIVDVAHDQVADVEIGVPATDIVEAADGTRGGSRAAHPLTSRRCACQELDAAQGVLLVHRADGGAPERPLPLSQHERGPRYGGARGSQV
jgi:hypothetical protein